MLVNFELPTSAVETAFRIRGYGTVKTVPFRKPERVPECGARIEEQARDEEGAHRGYQSKCRFLGSLRSLGMTTEMKAAWRQRKKPARSFTVAAQKQQA
ncbi:MAG: hypothetical protein A3F68_10885 [Acidobacteria bacterium RIFCSPLOWO2_12_FULL_54_10]|nr:MAG: hypothetical protein A3F68_10885 [Acidobacteria bacterium RIFCSPLOWO2_12_FULL_54_10]